MKFPYKIILLFLVVFNSNSQVKYLSGTLQYTLETNLSNKGQAMIDCELHFNKTTSISYHTKIRHSNPEVLLQPIDSKTDVYQYKDMINRTMLVSADPKHIVKDTMTNILWSIKKESKKVGGYKCNKATAFVRGRNYTVWYCPEIPISSGPWKFYGLPGLILEGYDDTNEVKFVFQSLNFEPKETKITVPKLKPKQIIVSHKMYVDIYNKRMLKMQKGITMSPEPGGEVTIKSQQNKQIEIWK